MVLGVIRSCQTQLVHTYKDLAVNRKRRLTTDVVILDFCKVFDSVCHRKLIFELAEIGISSQIIL